jgi:hypothetical protein
MLAQKLPADKHWPSHFVPTGQADDYRVLYLSNPNSRRNKIPSLPLAIAASYVFNRKIFALNHLPAI